MPSPPEATLINRRYRLESLLAEGGMASVWRAIDETLQRPVAVKLLRPREDRSAEKLVEHFIREARLAAAVSHPNVIKVVDFGTVDGTQAFMAMELLEGETLANRIATGGMPPAEILRVADLTLRGLHTLHAAGIVHRDLKPANIFLARDADGAPFPKILDFGISRSVDPTSGRRSALTTQAGKVVGTPAYMSPEQARGHVVDKRADIWGVGVVLYEALTGRPPFSATGLGDLLIEVAMDTPPPMHEVNPAIPIAVSNVVSKAMEKSPDDRYADAAEMREALQEAALAVEGADRWMASDRPVLPKAPDEQSPLESVESMTASIDITLSDAPRVRPSVRRRWLAVGAVAVAVALLVIWAQVSPSGVEPAARLEPGARTELPTPPTTEATAAAPELSVVRLRDVAEGASVRVNGEVASGDRFEFPRDGSERVIEVVSPGKTPWRVVHRASADADYAVVLDDLPQPRAQRVEKRTEQTASAPSKSPRAPRNRGKGGSGKPQENYRNLRALDF